VNIVVSGTFTTSSAPKVYLEQVSVRLGSTGTMKVAQIQGNKWSYSGLVTVEGPLTITIQATGWYYGMRDGVKGVEEIGITRSVNQSVTVSFDNTPPTGTVDSAGSNVTVNGPGPKVPVVITGSASDSQSGVARVEYEVDGTGFQIATPTSGWSRWQAPLELALGTHVVDVRCTDKVNHTSSLGTVRVEAKDNTGPELTVDQSEDFFLALGDPTGADVKLSGTVSDTGSGVQGVWLKVNESSTETAVTVAPDGTWSQAVRLPPDLGYPPDLHHIKVRATDKVGNPTLKEKPVRVSRTHAPGDHEDNVSSYAYFGDLIEFARSYVEIAPPVGNARSLGIEDLTEEFLQPFDRVTSGEPVRQLRLGIEVLRKFFAPNDAVARWKFDEGNGTTTADASGNPSIGTLQGGTTWSPGRVGESALSFDGQNDYVQVGAAPKLVMRNSLSISAWIYPKGVGSHTTEGGIIINKEGEYELARFADGTI
jgi:hypothetical protein